MFGTNRKIKEIEKNVSSMKKEIEEIRNIIRERTCANRSQLDELSKRCDIIEGYIQNLPLPKEEDDAERPHMDFQPKHTFRIDKEGA